MENRNRPDGREQRGDRTAQALLRAACTAFAERGFAGASVRDIADEAGANPALIRYHFGSKQGLYRRIVDDAVARLRYRLSSAAIELNNPRVSLQAMLDALIDFMAAERDFPRLIQRALLDGSTDLGDLAQSCLGPLREVIEACVGERADTDEILTSLWSAAVTPFTYAPLLDPFLGRELNSPVGLESRRRHLHLLAQNLLGESD